VSGLSLVQSEKILIIFFVIYQTLNSKQAQILYFSYKLFKYSVKKHKCSQRCQWSIFY